MIQTEKSATLCPNNDQVLFAMQGFGDYTVGGVTSSVKARDYKNATDLIVVAPAAGFLPKAGAKAGNIGFEIEQTPTLLSEQTVAAFDTAGTVRRLTPLECERLQGFPDHWTDVGPWADSKGKLHKESTDSARYKALGNSIALPPWAYVLTRLSLCAAEEPTMASLFDGIGGFPLIWEWLNGKGSCLWASEIEDFPIAVTKEHFPDENDSFIPLF